MIYDLLGLALGFVIITVPTFFVAIVAWFVSKVPKNKTIRAIVFTAISLSPIFLLVYGFVDMAINKPMYMYVDLGTSIGFICLFTFPVVVPAWVLWIIREER